MPVAAYLKAIIAALIAAGSFAVGALDDGALSAQEGLGALVAGLVALGAVFGIPNTPQPPRG